jgi:hypothetical protein
MGMIDKIFLLTGLILPVLSSFMADNP